MAVAIPLAIAAASAAVSYSQARSQNSAIRRSMASANKSATTSIDQTDAAAEVEQQKRANEAAKILGRVRVAAGEQGTGYGGTYQALERQSAYDEAVNAWIIDQNRQHQINRINSGLEANLTELSNRGVNSALATVGAGIQGASTGLQLYGAGKQAELWK